MPYFCTDPIRLFHAYRILKKISPDDQQKNIFIYIYEIYNRYNNATKKKKSSKRFFINRTIGKLYNRIKSL